MNVLTKIFLILASIILLVIGGFSIYKIFLGTSSRENVKITVNTTPTTTPSFLANNNVPTQTPKTTLFPAENTPTPTDIPGIISITPTSTSIPLKSPTTKPTSTPKQTPTTTILPTVKPSLYPTQTIENKLPIAGNSIPTLILLAFGLILLLPLMLL